MRASIALSVLAACAAQTVIGWATKSTSEINPGAKRFDISNISLDQSPNLTS